MNNKSKLQFIFPLGPETANYFHLMTNTIEMYTTPFSLSYTHTDQPKIDINH